MINFDCNYNNNYFTTISFIYPINFRLLQIMQVLSLNIHTYLIIIIIDRTVKRVYEFKV